jgi:formylglycine-generating enzyme required for sulfatase activity
LQQWLLNDRTLLIWIKRARIFFEEWCNSDRNPSSLLRGKMLEEGENWIADRGANDIDPSIHEYLKASIAQRKEEVRIMVLQRIEQLLTCELDRIEILFQDELLKQLDSQRILQLQSNTADSGRRWRLDVLSLEEEGELPDSLIEKILTGTGREVQVIAEELARRRVSVVKLLLTIAGKQEDARAWFRACVVMARVSPGLLEWQVYSKRLLESLLSEGPVSSGAWLSLLQAIKKELRSEVADKFTKSNEMIANEFLSQIAVSMAEPRGDANLLTSCLVNSTGAAFRILIEASKIGDSSDVLNLLLKVATDNVLHSELENERIRIGKRKAAAIIAMSKLSGSLRLSHLNFQEVNLEPLSQFSIMCKEYAVPLEMLFDAAAAEACPLRFQALLHAIAEYPKLEVQELSRNRDIEALAQRASVSDHSGVAIASQWFLGNVLGTSSVALPLEESMPTVLSLKERSWFALKCTELGEGARFTVIQYKNSRLGTPSQELGRNPNESPIIQVPLEHTFAAFCQPVTKSQFLIFAKDLDESKLKFINEYSPSMDCPVTGVTWHEAIAYCNWLSLQVGMTPDMLVYKVGTDDVAYDISKPGFRLPLESEWEAMCRSGTETTFSFGSDYSILERYAVYDAIHSHPVGKLRPTHSGLFDIHGNCWEWCSDPLKNYADYSTPEKISEVRPCLRGGCWTLNGRYCRSGCRSAHLPTNRNYYIGFRVVCTLA